MMKMFVASLAVLSLVACARTRENPNKAADPTVDSQQVLDQKAAAEKQAAADKLAAGQQANPPAQVGDAQAPLPPAPVGQPVVQGDGQKPATQTPVPLETPAPGATVVNPAQTPAPGATSSPAQSPAPATAPVKPIVVQAVKPGPTETPTTVAPETVKRDYTGKTLSIFATPNSYLASVGLEGVDAQTLYEAMHLIPTIKASTGAYLPAEAKIGKSVACYKQTLKITPKVPRYSCAFSINYRTGGIFEQEKPSKPDTKNKAITKAYKSGTLIIGGDKLPANMTAIALIRADDAKILFGLLTAPSVSKTPNAGELEYNKKESFHVDCFSRITKADPKKTDYICSLPFVAETGDAPARSTILK